MNVDNFLKNADWDVVAKAMKTLKNYFNDKTNRDKQSIHMKFWKKLMEGEALDKSPVCDSASAPD